MKPVHDRNSAPQRTDGDGRKATFFGFELAVHLLGQPHGLCDGANIFNKKLCERGDSIFQGHDPDRHSRIG